MKMRRTSKRLQIKKELKNLDNISKRNKIQKKKYTKD